MLLTPVGETSSTADCLADAVDRPESVVHHCVTLREHDNPLARPATLGTTERRTARGASSAPAMTPDTLVGLLAEPGRLRVFAAVALGARTDAETASASGLPPREVAAALRRLADGGALLAAPDGWSVAVDALRQAARDSSVRSRADAPEQPEDRRLAPFVVGRTLASLPAAQGRRRIVLEHVAASSFEPGRRYDERAVDARLRPWCDGGEVDHAALRRYLVEAGLLLRGGGVYALPSRAEPPAPGAGESYVAALGLS